MQKLLIIRFSSFGDIVQATAAAHAFYERYPQSEIHWLARSDMADFLELCPYIHKIWKYDRNTGISGLKRLKNEINKNMFTHVYDAHNNLRSRLLSPFLPSLHFARRSKNRWKRFQQFQLGQKVIEMPFRGASSFVEPLKKWDNKIQFPTTPTFVFNFEQENKAQQVLKRIGVREKSYVAIAASAAWPLKRWPLEHFARLIQSLDCDSFVVLGGPKDSDLLKLSSASLGLPAEKVKVVTGQLSLLESSYICGKASAVVANDTGLLHVADAFMVPTVALIGPSAFGYPARSTSATAELALSCKPCSKDGRGKCKNQTYQKCLKDLSPEYVSQKVQSVLQMRE